MAGAAPADVRERVGLCSSSSRKKCLLFGVAGRGHASCVVAVPTAAARTCPPVEKVPASHALQELAPVALFVWLPAPQNRHSPVCAWGA